MELNFGMFCEVKAKMSEMIRMLGLGGGIEHAGLTPPEAPLCCGSRPWP